MTAPSTYRFDYGLNPWHPGLGDTATTIASQGAGVASGILSIFGVATALSGPLAPFVALAGVLTAVLGQVFSGCGQTCILSSQDANKVEQILQQNLATYMAGGHTISEQQAALQIFNQAWQALVNACGQASLGQAGQNCISDRQAGSCKWKTSPGGWSNGTYTYPGASGSGSTCWNWWIGYHDPIANDPTVVPDPVTTTAAGSTGTATTSSITGLTTSGTNYLPMILLGLGLLLAATA